MKVSLYTESFKPYLSGVTVSVDAFAKGLTNLGHEVTVCAPWYPEFTDKDKYKVFRFPSVGIKNYPGFRLAVPFSPKHNFLEKPDIVHSHSPYQLGCFAQRYALKRGIPFVYHFHTLFTEYLHFVPVSRWISEPLVKAIVRNYCKKCDLMIVPTPIVKDILKKDYGVEQRIEVLPTGVDEDLVANANPFEVRKKYGVKPDDILLGYCGRLSKEKNIEFLLKVFKRIYEEFENVKLMLTGFGPLEEELKATAQRLGIAGRVIFTGRIERTEVYDYLKAADIFICASKTETQGLVLSEAKACGKPAVAISANGAACMITDGVDGFLVEDDLDQFSQKVRELIKNQKLRAQLAENAYNLALANYFNAAVTKKLEALYNSIRV